MKFEKVFQNYTLNSFQTAPGSARQDFAFYIVEMVAAAAATAVAVADQLTFVYIDQAAQDVQCYITNSVFPIYPTGMVLICLESLCFLLKSL